MADGDYSEFSIAHDRLYTLEHLWLQVLDEDKDDGSVDQQDVNNNVIV